MNALMLQQQGLLDALFARPGRTQSTGALHHLHAQLDTHMSRGLMVYQANGHALAERCLRAAYPVIAQLKQPPESFGYHVTVFQRPKLFRYL